MVNSFTKYLQEQGFSPSSITTYEREIRQYKIWLEQENIRAKEISNRDIIAYMVHLREQDKHKRTINHYINSISRYYDYLGIAPNPTAELKVRGINRNIKYRLLSRKELDGLYQNYEGSVLKKVLLSLLVYQGIQSSELPHIKKEHIDLEKGKIRITGSKKTASRTLALEAHQILPLQQLMNSHPNEYLLLETGKQTTLRDRTAHIMRSLRAKHPHFKRASQIRSSLIAEWLKTENLRLVQYKAGHRYISSTEKYLLGGVADLQRALDKYHPL